MSPIRTTCLPYSPHVSHTHHISPILTTCLPHSPHVSHTPHMSPTLTTCPPYSPHVSPLTTCLPTHHMPHPSRVSEYRSLISLNVTNGIHRADKICVFSVRRELRYYVILRSQFCNFFCMEKITRSHVISAPVDRSDGSCCGHLGHDTVGSGMFMLIHTPCHSRHYRNILQI